MTTDHSSPQAHPLSRASPLFTDASSEGETPPDSPQVPSHAASDPDGASSLLTNDSHKDEEAERPTFVPVKGRLSSRPFFSETPSPSKHPAKSPSPADDNPFFCPADFEDVRPTRLAGRHLQKMDTLPPSSVSGPPPPDSPDPVDTPLRSRLTHDSDEESDLPNKTDPTPCRDDQEGPTFAETGSPSMVSLTLEQTTPCEL